MNASGLSDGSNNNDIDMEDVGNNAAISTLRRFEFGEHSSHDADDEESSTPAQNTRAEENHAENPCAGNGSLLVEEQVTLHDEEESAKRDLESNASAGDESFAANVERRPDKRQKVDENQYNTGSRETPSDGFEASSRLSGRSVQDQVEACDTNEQPFNEQACLNGVERQSDHSHVDQVAMTEAEAPLDSPLEGNVIVLSSERPITLEKQTGVEPATSPTIETDDSHPLNPDDHGLLFDINVGGSAMEPEGRYESAVFFFLK